MEKSLKALKDKMNDSEYCVHGLEHNQDAIQSWRSKLEKISKALKKAKEHMQYLENQLPERSHQLLCKDTEARSRNNKVSALEEQVTDLKVKLDRYNAQNSTGKPPLVDVRTPMAIR